MKKIVKCEIKKGRFMNIISVLYDDGSEDDGLGSYYPDELSFSEDEFIGLTKDQAQKLMHQRDMAYLRRWSKDGVLTRALSFRVIYS